MKKTIYLLFLIGLVAIITNLQFAPPADAVNFGKYMVCRQDATPTITLNPIPTLPTSTPTPTPVGPTSTPSLTAPQATPTTQSGTTRILCDGRTYDGSSAVVIKLDGGEAADPAIQKIIRNCTFKNSPWRQIVLKNAKNVLIENNIFANIRTNQPGKGTHGISVSPDTAKVVDNIIVRGNSFSNIGADGVQIGEGTGDKTSNFIIENNTFIGSEAVGENGVDVKGAIGPIIIRNNIMHGFRPCQSPQKGGNQDCSGSPGEGLVIHEGTSGRPNNVTIEGNLIYDNIFGISISNLAANSLRVLNNQIRDHLDIGINVRNSSNVLLSGNIYSNNKTNCGGISPCN